VDEGGGLQGLAGRFVGHLGGGQLAQILIDERQQLLGGLRVALLDPVEDKCDFAVLHEAKP
jgi:phosphoribosylaminoimidazole carboxylase (NCAIR synthetase)